MNVAGKKPRLVRKRVSKAARKALGGRYSPNGRKLSEGEFVGSKCRKTINGIDYMEMIDWDEYEEPYFARLKNQQKQYIFNMVLNSCKNVDIKELALEMS